MTEKTGVSEARGVALLDLLFTVATAQLGDSALVQDEEGNEVRAYTATPALLTFAAKLLKDNSITLQADEVEKKNAVAQALEDRKKQSRLASVSYLNPEAATG
jgi:hypothetical protein